MLVLGLGIGSYLEVSLPIFMKVLKDKAEKDWFKCSFDKLKYYPLSAEALTGWTELVLFLILFILFDYLMARSAAILLAYLNSSFSLVSISFDFTSLDLYLLTSFFLKADSSWACFRFCSFFFLAASFYFSVSFLRAFGDFSNIEIPEILCLRILLSMLSFTPISNEENWLLPLSESPESFISWMRLSLSLFFESLADLGLAPLSYFYWTSDFLSSTAKIDEFLTYLPLLGTISVLAAVSEFNGNFKLFCLFFGLTNLWLTLSPDRLLFSVT